MNLDL